MANLEQIINRKTAADNEWKEIRQMERQNAADMRDAGVMEITGSPEVYARYLQMQGDNPTYSAGNVALVMFGLPEATQFGTAERWKSLGRFVQDSELDNGVKLFAKQSFPSRGYTLTAAYDISQTQGKAVKEIYLRDDSSQMDAAMATLLNYAPVQVISDQELSCPARYDEQQLALYVNPTYSDSEAFSAIAAEIAHARLHNKGNNRFYDRAESELDAQSISYILCKHFHVARGLPDTSRVAHLYEGWEVEQRTEALDKIHEMSKQIGRSIERSVTPEKQRGKSLPSRPVR